MYYRNARAYEIITLAFLDAFISVNSRFAFATFSAILSAKIRILRRASVLNRSDFFFSIRARRRRLRSLRLREKVVRMVTAYLAAQQSLYNLDENVVWLSKSRE